MKKFRVSAAVFDFDGTLVDSSIEGLRRVKIICEEQGVFFNKEGLVKYWGLPVVELLQKGLCISEELATKLNDRWAEWDRAEPMMLIPGARETLEMNRLNGIMNFLLTSRRIENASHAVRGLTLTDFFEEVCGMDGCERGRACAEVYVKKPDPRAFDPILRYLEGRGIPKEEILFVGDTTHDVECGLAAGIETIAVLTGMEGEEKLLSKGLPKENVILSIADLYEWMILHRNGHSK